MLVRLSIPGAAPYAKLIEQVGVVPEPVYGGQLQDMAVPGVQPEGKVRVDYTPVNVTFKDGTVVELRKPDLQITQLGYGPMHPDTRFSARIAPPMIGLGLLEAISDADILRNTDPKTVAKAAKHVRDLVGIEHAALGSDFDGATTTRFDTSKIVHITQALMEAGFTEDEIRAVMGLNALRVIKQGLVPLKDLPEQAVELSSKARQ